MKLFYSSGAMGYAGEGYFWHKFYNFPALPYVTKTLTYNPKLGLPFAVLPIGKSVYNKVSLHNCGIYDWLNHYHQLYSSEPCTVSIHGTDEEIQIMVEILDLHKNIEAIELNFSCPNVKNPLNTKIPVSKHPLYLKLNHLQDPYSYDLTHIVGIRLNSVPMKFGAGSGAVAKEKNWEFIKRWNKLGLNVAGCSFTTYPDIEELEDMGCTELGIGSTIITSPQLIEILGL